MKNRKNKWYLRALTMLLVSALATVTVAAAEAGSAGDPLVTLSYLNETFLPKILSQVQQKTSGGGGSVFEAVSIPKGQALTLGVGAEVMLRAGTAVCAAGSAPGLIDETSGGSLNNGGALVQNHLYMATVEGRSVKASADARVMVRGSYSVA